MANSLIRIIGSFRGAAEVALAMMMALTVASSWIERWLVPWALGDDCVTVSAHFVPAMTCVLVDCVVALQDTSTVQTSAILDTTFGDKRFRCTASEATVKHVTAMTAPNTRSTIVADEVVFLALAYFVPAVFTTTAAFSLLCFTSGHVTWITAFFASVIESVSMTTFVDASTTVTTSHIDLGASTQAHKTVAAILAKIVDNR